MSEQHIVVCGGRLEHEQVYVPRVLTELAAILKLEPGATITHGNARGVDRTAGSWARRNGFRNNPMPVSSALDGYKEDAPLNRNKRMRDTKPDAVVGFPGGNGTFNMIKIADEAGIPIYDVEISLATTSIIIWRYSTGFETPVVVWEGTLHA